MAFYFKFRSSWTAYRRRNKLQKFSETSNSTKNAANSVPHINLIEGKRAKEGNWGIISISNEMKVYYATFICIQWALAQSSVARKPEQSTLTEYWVFTHMRWEHFTGFSLLSKQYICSTESQCMVIGKSYQIEKNHLLQPNVQFERKICFRRLHQGREKGKAIYEPTVMHMQ